MTSPVDHHLRVVSDSCRCHCCYKARERRRDVLEHIAFAVACVVVVSAAIYWL